MSDLEWVWARKNDEDIEAVRERFPFIVKRLSYRDLELEVGHFMLPLGENAVVISKIPQGPAQNFPPVLITYGFKREDDAVAFALRFKGV